MKARDESALDYFRKTKPVQWVEWHAALEDSEAKSALDYVLFDPVTHSLRDLTAASVRTAVADCVSRYPSLKALVSNEADEVIEDILQHSTKTR